MRRALPSALAVLVLAGAWPTEAAAYDRQVTLGPTVGWAIAPALSPRAPATEAPDHGPVGGLDATIGFGDTWGVGLYLAWAVHPPFSGGEPYQFGLAGAEALYFLDILQVVPFFGLGVDVIPSYEGNTDTWGADFAAHVRASIDYLLSREVLIGADVRIYILPTALSLDPVYLTFQARLGFVFGY